MSEMTPNDIETVNRLYALFGPPRIRYCPWIPTPRQEAFLLMNEFEVFYGGAAAGGKTAALLMSTLQYADVPGYDALIVRKSRSELSLPGNLIELSHKWLGSTDAEWNGAMAMWRFPGGGRSGAGGATISFGYLGDDGDLTRYAGSSFSFLAFDELTCFPEHHYRRMMRVLRQPTAQYTGTPAPDGLRLGDVPVRLRSASNPGGVYHEWVRARFVDPQSRPEGVRFLPARLIDNPHIAYDSYAGRLAELPPAEHERLLYGNWDVLDDGELFRREWFPVVEPHQLPVNTIKLRYWDLAATEPSPANRDPDWSVGLLLELDVSTGIFYISDVVRERLAAGAIERLVRKTAERDGREVAVRIEQDGGGAGKALVAHYTREVLRGFDARGDRADSKKYLRAQPVAAAAQNGYVRVVRGRHTRALLDELVSFPNGRHDDTVDALAGAHKHVANTPRGRQRRPSSPARHRIPGVDGRSGVRSSSGRGDAVDQFAWSRGITAYDTRNLPRRIV